MTRAVLDRGILETDRTTMNAQIFTPVAPRPRLGVNVAGTAVLALLAASCASSPEVMPEAMPASDSSRPTASRTVQPGAPGEDTRTFEAVDPSNVGGLQHTEADVAFMQGMIPHHAQALEMTALVPSRAASAGFEQLALRMEISQRDEIDLMTRWLNDRGEDATDHSHHMMSGGMAMMPGMLTPDQMQQLAAASGVEFERLFLEFMIQHHEGAIVMVTDLFDTPGAGQESEIFQFASHVDADQRMEIARMRQMLEDRR